MRKSHQNVDGVRDEHRDGTRGWGSCVQYAASDTINLRSDVSLLAEILTTDAHERRTYRAMVSEEPGLEGWRKSMLDCLCRGRLNPLPCFCCEESRSVPSSSAIVSLAASSFARRRASSMILALVARREWGHSVVPLARITPFAILSRRFDGGTGPLNGVRMWAGRASNV